MPRTVPAAISAKISTNYALRFLWLVEWRLSGGTKYLSSGQSVSFGGNTYEANRATEISGLTAQYIDRTHQEFSDISIKLDNLADDGSSSFPYTVLDASQVFEDAQVLIHFYDVDAADGVANVWFGHSKRPTFSPDKTVDLAASFLWNSSELVVPAVRLEKAGFSTLETNRSKSDDEEREDTIPLVFGVTNIKVRPVIYAARVEGNHLHVNFIVSGTQSGFPFSSGDVISALLFDVTSATEIEFLTGTSGQAAPGNKTRFPDGEAHTLVAYGYASFAITDDQKSDIENLEPEDIRIKLANGRPLVDTGLPSENPVLILKDILRDPVYGLGLASAAFDASVVSAAAAYAATRYQVRVELREQEPLVDIVQRILKDCHCFLTFNSGLIQIRHKSNSEASAATFATSDSGVGGRVIHEDEVTAWEKDFGELVNQVEYQYRKKNRHKRRVIAYDLTAQNRAGGNIKKVESEEVESYIHDETEASISAAIWLKEEQTQNLFCRFAVPLLEGLDVAPGDIIEVRSPDIFSNGSNKFFRIISQTFDTGDEPLCHIECQIYKAATYDDTTSGVGVDLLRGSRDTSQQGRPPDVTPVSVQVVDLIANDVEGKMAHIRGTWTYPAVDLATEQADNVFREYPIGAVQLWWDYTDESPNQARLGGEVQYPTAQLDFEIDYRKNKSIQVWFVALGHNRSRSKLGYIPDETKETWLTASLSATAPTASVNATTNFAVDNYAFIENEIAKVASKTSNSITFVSSGGNRTAQFNTTAIAHPSGTEVTVAKLSYPVLTLALTAPRFTYPTVTGLVARQRNEGVRLGWTDPSADNEEKFLLYWSTDGDALSNSAKLGSATPTWYTTDPNTPGAGVNLVKTDALSHEVLQEAIGAAGTTVAARVAARNGKHNFSAALSASASNKLGDDAVPTVASAPKAIWKKKGLRVVVALPTSNMQTFAQSGKVEVVIRAKNGGGAILGYLTDASGAYASDASEFKLNLALARAHTFNISKSDLTSIWATIATLEVYCYVSNAVGSSAASSITSLTVSTMEGDPLDPDTAAPGNLPTPTFKFKRGKLLAKMDMAAVTNVQTLKDRVELCITDGTDSLNLDDPTSETKASGIVFYQVSVAHKTLPYDRDQLIRIFGASATIKCRFKLTNDVGPTTSADSATIALSGLTDVTTLNQYGQMLNGGEFAHAVSGTPTAVKHWSTYNPTDGSFNDWTSGTAVLTTSNKFRWSDTGHFGFWRNLTNQNDTRFPMQELPKIFTKGDYYSFTWVIWSNTTLTIDEFSVALFARKTAANNVAVTSGQSTISGSGFDTDGIKIGDIVTIVDTGEWRTVTNVNSSTLLTVDRPWTATDASSQMKLLSLQSDKLKATALSLNTTELLQRGTVQIRSDADVSSVWYFTLVAREDTLLNNTTDFIQFKRPCMAPGRAPVAYHRKATSYESNGAGTSEDFDAPGTAAEGGTGQDQGQGGGAGVLQ